LEFSSGIELSLLCGGQLVQGDAQFVLSIEFGNSECLSLFGELAKGLLEVQLCLGFLFLIIDDGLSE
jgi:hypothetical protein